MKATQDQTTSSDPFSFVCLKKPRLPQCSKRGKGYDSSRYMPTFLTIIKERALLPVYLLRILSSLNFPLAFFD